MEMLRKPRMKARFFNGYPTRKQGRYIGSIFLNQKLIPPPAKTSIELITQSSGYLMTVL